MDFYIIFNLTMKFSIQSLHKPCIIWNTLDIAVLCLVVMVSIIIIIIIASLHPLITTDKGLSWHDWFGWELKWKSEEGLKRVREREGRLCFWEREETMERGEGRWVVDEEGGGGGGGGGEEVKEEEVKEVEKAEEEEVKEEEVMEGELEEEEEEVGLIYYISCKLWAVHNIGYKFIPTYWIGIVYNYTLLTFWLLFHHYSILLYYYTYTHILLLLRILCITTLYRIENIELGNYPNVSNKYT